MNKHNKKIAIVAWETGENSFGVTKPYLHYLSHFGNVMMILPQQIDIIKDIDLLVLPGGADVNPLRYNQIPSFYTGRPNVYLEHFDNKVLPKYIENETPIFGICRGLQNLNVFFEGTLKQHLYSHPTSSIRSDKVHDVINYIDVLQTTKHFKNSIDEKFKKTRTNSLHHQAIDILGNGFEILSRSKSYGKEIEAIVHKYLPIAAVQYHPEELLTDPIANSLINCLLNIKNNE
jgi:putative glutamine amidotransferase